MKEEDPENAAKLSMPGSGRRYQVPSENKKNLQYTLKKQEDNANQA